MEEVTETSKDRGGTSSIKKRIWKVLKLDSNGSVQTMREEKIENYEEYINKVIGYARNLEKDCERKQWKKGEETKRRDMLKRWCMENHILGIVFGKGKIRENETKEYEEYKKGNWWKEDGQKNKINKEKMKKERNFRFLSRAEKYLEPPQVTTLSFSEAAGNAGSMKTHLQEVATTEVTINEMKMMEENITKDEHRIRERSRELDVYSHSAAMSRTDGEDEVLSSTRSRSKPTAKDHNTEQRESSNRDKLLDNRKKRKLLRRINSISELKDIEARRLKAIQGDKIEFMSYLDFSRTMKSLLAKINNLSYEDVYA